MGSPPISTRLAGTGRDQSAVDGCATPDVSRRRCGERPGIAGFNPGLSLGPNAAFDDSDPMSFYSWDDPRMALTWAQLSGEPYRTSQAEPHSGSHRTIVNLITDVAVGDLVFVLRTPPTDINKKGVLDPLGWRRQAHLVGVWWVEAEGFVPKRRWLDLPARVLRSARALR